MHSMSEGLAAIVEAEIKRWQRSQKTRTSTRKILIFAPNLELARHYAKRAYLKTGEWHWVKNVLDVKGLPNQYTRAIVLMGDNYGSFTYEVSQLDAYEYVLRHEIPVEYVVL